LTAAETDIVIGQPEVPRRSRLTPGGKTRTASDEPRPGGIKFLRFRPRCRRRRCRLGGPARDGTGFETAVIDLHAGAASARTARSGVRMVYGRVRHARSEGSEGVVERSDRVSLSDHLATSEYGPSRPIAALGYLVANGGVADIGRSRSRKPWVANGPKRDMAARWSTGQGRSI
jgi:hypothetical protein